MPYLLNPHRHVKIWLSNDRNVFMNQVNQLRLIKMRVDNPGDIIHLAYAQSLLSAPALESLRRFCERHQIVPICIETDIIQNCRDRDERNLLDLYQAEIAAIGAGGNVASASDLLRLVSGIFHRGIYSDFDTEINTQELPSEIPVLQPIIANIGSIDMSRQLGLDVESVCMGTDFMAIFDCDEAAKKRIRSIQQKLYRSYRDVSTYTDSHKRLHNELSRLLRPFPVPLASLPDFPVANSLATPAERGLTTPISIRRFLMQNVAIEKRKTDPLYNHFIKASVLYSTGPAQFSLFLLEKLHWTRTDIDKHVAPYSLKHYVSDRHFRSNNGVGLHCTLADYNQRFIARNESERYSISDEAWLDGGAAEIVKKVKKMEEGAHTIQSFFIHSFFKKSVKATNVEINCSVGAKV